MARADISPAGAAEFFERLRGPADGGAEEPGWTGWIQTHPSPVDRAKAFRDAVEQDEEYPPALTEAEFAAIRSMCDEDVDVEDFGFF
jgi:predicted Zn-dependent protease